jgi:HSP20 family molecular chaperone IbpA
LYVKDFDLIGIFNQQINRFKMNTCNRTLALFPKARQMMLAPKRNFFFHHRRSPWDIVDISNQMESMERTFARIEQDMNTAFRFPLPRVFHPHGSRFMFRPLLEGETKVGEKEGKYIVKMNLGNNFNPENVKITLKDRVVNIEAKFEHKSEDGNSRLYQELCKSFTLPENVKVEEMKCLFTPEGELLIEAPLPPEVIEAPKPKEIPISVEK